MEGRGVINHRERSIIPCWRKKRAGIGRFFRFRGSKCFVGKNIFFSLLELNSSCLKNGNRCVHRCIFFYFSFFKESVDLEISFYISAVSMLKSRFCKVFARPNIHIYIKEQEEERKEKEGSE